MITLICWILAAIFNAAMDVVAYKYDSSIFRKINKHKYYDKRISWRNKYIDGFPHNGRTYWSIGKFKIIKYDAFTDAWHLFKSLMIICLAISIVTYQYDNPAISLIQFCILFFVWIKVFNLFYKKILRI